MLSFQHINTNPIFRLILLCLLFSLSFPANGFNASQIFDVTKYGASTSKNDSKQAFLDAWKDACSFNGTAIFVIPNGTFMLGPVDFEGPCKHGTMSPSVEIKGKLKALPGSANFPDGFWIKFTELKNLTVAGGGLLDGQGDSSWPEKGCQSENSCNLPPPSLKFDQVSNSIISNLTLINSKAFHISIHQCDHIDVQNVNISAPWYSPNTDGIHIGNTSFIRIKNSVIATGDDCISIGPGSKFVNIANVNCGPGHGISVGSLGKYKGDLDVIGVVAKNCTLNNTTNGVRIKTWPGSTVSRAINITFEDIKMINVSNPIIIDQRYCPGEHCSDTPSRVQISNVAYKRISGTSGTKVAINLLCSELTPCKNVELADVKLTCSGPQCDKNTTSSCSHVNGTFSGIQIPGPCSLLRG